MENYVRNVIKNPAIRVLERSEEYQWRVVQKNKDVQGAMDIMFSGKSGEHICVLFKTTVEYGNERELREVFHYIQSSNIRKKTKNELYDYALERGRTFSG